MALGAGIWLAPRPTLAALGFGRSDPQVMALARLAGTRDLATGALAVAASGDPVRSASVARLNAAIDAGDALTFAGALRRRDGIDKAAIPGLLGAGGAAAFGLWLAGRLGSPALPR
jgi:hypothetical protein